MADWVQSGIQIVVAIIGSGLIVTALNGLVTEINRPHINIAVDDDSTITPYDNETICETSFVNSGDTPVSNVRLTMYYPGQEIKNYSVIEASENASFVFFNATPSILASPTPRLSSGATNVITTTVTGNLEADDAYNANYENSFSVTATYDEGSDIYPLKGSWDRYTILVFLIYSVLSALPFAIALRYKDIHESIENRIKVRKQVKFIFQIFQDIVEAKNTFTKDIRSIKFISTEKWKSYPSQNKFLVFSSLDDYLKVDRFYMGLEKRNQQLFARDFKPRYNEF